jgi:hypothetical protein
MITLRERQVSDCSTRTTTMICCCSRYTIDLDICTDVNDIDMHKRNLFRLLKINRLELSLFDPQACTIAQMGL